MNSEPEPIGIMAALLRIEQKYGLPQRPSKLILPENLPMPCDKKESSDVQLSSLECHGQNNLSAVPVLAELQSQRADRTMESSEAQESIKPDFGVSGRSGDPDLAGTTCGGGQTFTPAEFRDRIKQQLFGGESYGG